MSLCEGIAARLSGTKLKAPAEWLQARRGAKFRPEHLGLQDWLIEGERTERALDRLIRPDTS